MPEPFLHLGDIGIAGAVLQYMETVEFLSHYQRRIYRNEQTA
jgi:hypothetical protein